MGQSGIRLLSTIPGARNLEPIVQEFCAQGSGIITAFSDGSLRALAALVPDESAVEIQPFGGVVCAFANLAGEDVMGIAQGGHYVAAIAAACEDLPENSPFAKTASFTGLHKALADTLGELSDWGISPEDLLEVSVDASPPLAAKLYSLGAIQIEAERLLAQLGRQLHCAHVGTCLDSKPKDPSFDRLLVLAGSEDCPASLAWLQWAAGCGAKVTVVTYRHASGAPMFAAAAHTEMQLGLTAKPVGKASGLLSALFTEATAESAKPAVEISSAADVLAECEWALRGCLQARSEGLQPNEVGIFVRDVQGYAPLLEASARRLGVPLVVSRRVPLMANSFARLVMSTLEFCAGTDVRGLLSIVRSSYFGMSLQARRDLNETLREARRSRGRQWEVLTEWATAHSEQYPWLSELLTWRQQAISEPTLLSGWSDRLRMLVGGLPVLAGAGPGYQRDLRAQSAMQRSLAHRASIQRVREGRPISLKEFIDVCKDVWSESDASVPPSEQGVAVTGTAAALGNHKRLFVLGMLEGVFPKRRSEDPILTDEDRRELSGLLRLRLPLPTSYDHARAERDELYLVCAAASERIAFSYPQTDDERDNVPAFYLTEIERATGGEVERISRSRGQLAPALEECLADCDSRLNVALASERDAPLPIAFGSVTAAAAVRRSDDDPLSPSELRAALQCPFSFFVRHTLNLHTGRRRARWSTLRKIPQAASLPSQPDPETAREQLLSALEIELEMMMADVPEWELALLRSGGVRLIEEWVRREFAARQVWPKDDGSVKPNSGFGSQGLRSSMGKFGELKGSVAAVSRMGDYNVVHLVESRSPTPDRSSSTKLSDRDTLYYGLHLMAAYDKSGAAALEIETMGGKRVLMVLPRLPNEPLNSRVQEGLEVVDLSPSDDPNLSKRLFYEEVKARLGEAVRHIRELRIDAVRGEHCAWCDYGELCRRSSEFGEEEESPFGVDRTVARD
jgi:hypothetical protein